MFRILMINKNYGDVCGIAEYGQYLSEAMPIEEVHVSKNIPQILPVLSDYNGVIVQWDYSFYPLHDLLNLVSECSRLKMPLLIVMHTYLYPDGEWNFGHGGIHISKYYEALKGTKIVVHNDFIKDAVNHDAPFLDVRVVHHGCLPPLDTQELNSDRLTIGTFGFCVPYKGFDKIAQLAKKCPQYNFKFYTAVKQGWTDSVDMGMWLKKFTKSLNNVELNTSFLPIDESIKKLSACDLIFMAYDDKVDVGASGAIRIAMASGRPVVITQVPFTLDFRGILTSMPNNNVDTMEGVIEDYFASRIDTVRQRQYLLKNNWVTTSTQMLAYMFEDDMESLEAIHPHPDRIYKDSIQKDRIDWLKRNVKEQFAEVGCATGYVTQYCGGGIGLDIDEVRLEVARRKRPKCTFANHPANWLPPEISGIDVMYPDILEHIPLKDAREAVGHALEAGNRVLITMPLPESPYAPNPEHIWLPTFENLNELYDGTIGCDLIEERDEHFYYSILERRK